MAIFYFLLGGLFTYLAITTAGESIFHFPTILLLIVAALDFFIGFRYLRRKKAQ